MAEKRKKRRWKYIIGLIGILLIGFVLYFNLVTRIQPPTELDPHQMGYERTQFGQGFFIDGENWFKQNEFGLWELYITGGPLDLGVKNGLLTSELVRAQEDAFVNQIRSMIPSQSYLRFLKYFLAWFNKDLDNHIRQEYLLEIYGVSAFASEDYGFIGPRYDRILNYHAAHDIGHALQNLNLVECTAFGIWDERTADSSLLIGRNFDFYVGDEFAVNKIVSFVRPESGYKFASIGWAGMIGVVSGMNEKGLSITLNSAKSDIPFGARTPVSIIAREILQYASTIDEAMEIASARESFVSESFLIGSAIDHKTVVIEKSTEQTVLFDPDTNFIILTNHFQSDALVNTPLNKENMNNLTSVYRHERVKELLQAEPVIDHFDAADILRNRKGKSGKDIGNGNELAINQLIAHHAIIFEPEKLRFWVSTAPWQLGPFLCYDLNAVFGYIDMNTETYNKALEIPADPFLNEQEYSNFLEFRRLAQKIGESTKIATPLPEAGEIFRDLIKFNPEYYHTYALIGRYYQEMEDHEAAMKYFNLALSKEISSNTEKDNIRQWLEECRNP